MSFQNRKQEGIILMITSFNQLYNFLSFFHQKKLMDNTKIYLTIFSDQVPDELILNLKQYIEKFVSVEVVFCQTFVHCVHAAQHFFRCPSLQGVLNTFQ